MLQRVGGVGATQQLQQAQQQLQQAQAALESHQARTAVDAASAASEAMQTLQPLVQRLGAVDHQLTATEQALGELTPDHAAKVREILNQGREQLRLASTQLGSAAGEDALKEAEWLASHAFKLGPDFNRTRQGLAAQINQMRESLPQMDQLLEQGRQEFDIVDEFAPSAWSDIRGNGSEATAAVEQARRLLDYAEKAAAGANPDWVAALDAADTAAARLQYARDLLSAITTRLHDLEAAQQKGANEVEQARRDVKLGWGYIRNNDADVGKEPEHALHAAEQVLATIDQQLSGGKPDWLQILSLVAQVRQHADKALAGARSEVEQMNARRDNVNTLAQAAEGELNKLANFARVHPLEVAAEQRAQIDGLATLKAEGARALAAADQAEEDARIAALDTAAGHFKRLVDQAQPLYAQVYERFQRLDTLRTEANTMAQTARQSLDNTASWYNSYGHVLPAGTNGRDQLEKAQRMWKAFNPQADERELQAIIEADKEANRLAHEAATTIQQAAQQYQQRYPQQQQRQGSDMGDILTGMVLGQLLGGGNRRHHDSWGGGFGGNWGGGRHHGGNIFGGGGGGGGLFGGGGSSGGGWGGGGDSGGGGHAGGGW